MNEQEDTNLPDWMLFIGKWGEALEGHRLIYHLLDSAAVADLLWQRALTPGARAQFAGWLGLPEADCGRLLAYWTSLHDLGKAAPAFQCKHAPTRQALELRGFDFPELTKIEVRHHSLLSQWILREFDRELNIQPERFFNQFRFAIGGHHGVFHVMEDEEIDKSKAPEKNLGGARWGAARRDLFSALTGLFQPPQPAPLHLNQTGRNAFFNLLTGFFVAADWVSSQDDLFQYYPAPVALPAYWAIAQERAQAALESAGWFGWQPDGARPGFEELFGFSPHPLQQAVLQAAEGLSEPFLMIVEAPTGSGKTEAAFMAADRAIQAGGLRGWYIAMPTQATSNQMFARTAKFLRKRYPNQKQINLQLAHGSALLNADFKAMRIAAVSDTDEDARPAATPGGSAAAQEGNVNALEWFLPHKRTLLAPFGVGTVDQALFSVLRTRHSFLRLFGLHRKVVIFDEVHAYDVYMQELFYQLLAWLRAVGTPVILLSATLPEKTRLELLRAYQPGAAGEPGRTAYPRLSMNDGHTIRALWLGAYPDRIVHLERVPRDPQAWIGLLKEKLSEGGCAAIICNTVDRAQAVYAQIQSAGLVDAQDLFLLHARMPYCWRKGKEDAILERFGKLEAAPQGPRRGIVVATQVIEQSLDLDFDLLISDLAPVDLLIQRIGRLQRHTGSAHPPVRPPALREPLCLVCQPEPVGAAGLPDFEKDQWVYDPAILQRTYFALAPYRTLALPSCSDELINLVYTDGPLATCSDSQNRELAGLYRKMLADQEKEITTAQKRMIGSVDWSSALGEKTAYLKENDQSVGKETQALTRNIILPSVQLVCLVRRDGRLYLLDDTCPIELAGAPQGAALEHALRSIVSVNKVEVVRHFQSQPRHAAWAKQPALRFAYPVVFEDGQALLSQSLSLRLNEELGLCLIAKQ